jgi:hypothetical protein
MNLHQSIHQRLQQQLGLPGADSQEGLNSALRLLAKWRSVLIQNTLIQHEGTTVISGPLKGLKFIHQSAEGCHIAKLLGCYEQPLHESIEAAIEAPYAQIINVGCAEGYYAVGMARRMPSAKVFAYDVNPQAQSACSELARLNGVENRITIGSLCSHATFEQHRELGRCLVLCDIESAESELLDPEQAPSLSSMDMIVEVHECIKPGLLALLKNRFEQTHHIDVIEDNGQRQLDHAPAWFKSLSHLDQLLAVWEWRTGPTPWMVLRAKSVSPAP